MSGAKHRRSPSSRSCRRGMPCSKTVFFLEKCVQKLHAGLKDQPFSPEALRQALPPRRSQPGRLPSSGISGSLLSSLIAGSSLPFPALLPGFLSGRCLSPAPGLISGTVCAFTTAKDGAAAPPGPSAQGERDELDLVVVDSHASAPPAPAGSGLPGAAVRPLQENNHAVQTFRHAACCWSRRLSPAFRQRAGSGRARRSPGRRSGRPQRHAQASHAAQCHETARGTSPQRHRSPR